VRASYFDNSAVAGVALIGSAIEAKKSAVRNWLLTVTERIQGIGAKAS